MKKNKNIGLIVLLLFFGMLTFSKINTYKKSNIIGENKLHQYFKHIQSDQSRVLNRKQLIIDSLQNIKQKSAEINFVEVSEFTDSLSVRWITANNVSNSNFVKFNLKKSEHISTTYISIPQDYKFVHADLKKILSVIEFNLINRSSLKIKDVLGDYLGKGAKSCNVFYLKGTDISNTISVNPITTKYEFDTRETDNESLFFVAHLLKNYSFEKFEKLWINSFVNFEEIYGVSYKNVIFDLAKNNNSVTTKYTKC